MRQTDFTDAWVAGPFRLRFRDYKLGRVWELLFRVGRVWGYLSWGRRHFTLSGGVGR